jgi:hypothetical protein
MIQFARFDSGRWTHYLLSDIKPGPKHYPVRARRARMAPFSNTALRDSDLGKYKM